MHWVRKIALVVIAAVIAGLAGVSAVAVEWHAQLATRGIVDPVTAHALPFWQERFGVNAELRLIPPDRLDQQLALMQSAGVHWVRQIFDWNVLEPRPGQFDWQTYDQVVSAVRQNPDIRIVAVLVNTPPWARDSRAPNLITAPPDQSADFAQFASAVAARYRESIDYYQVWDEPNLLTNWGMLPPSASQYAVLLDAAAPAIRESDSTAFVIAAGLAPTQERGPDNVNEIDYLSALLTYGAADMVDAFAAKPYGFNTSPDDRSIDDDVLNFSRVVKMYETLSERLDRVPPIWATQWGWNTLPSGWTGLPSIWGSVTQEQQVAYTLRALDRIDAEWPWMGPVILHHWNPPFRVDHPQQGFALTTPEGLPTPLLAALTERAQVPRSDAPAGWHSVRTPFAEYSGVWTFTEAEADIGWLRDSRLSFSFSGTDVALLLRQGDYVAHLYATVDGLPANALPRDASGRSYVALLSADRKPSQGPVVIASGLSPGSHTLEIVADQGFDQYALIGYAVGSRIGLTDWNGWRFASQVALLSSLAGLAGVLWFVEGLGSFKRALHQVFSGLSVPVQLVLAGVSSAALMLTMVLSFGAADSAWVRRDPLLALVAIVSAGTVYVNLTLPITVIALIVLQWCIFQRLVLGLALAAFFAPFFLFPVELYRFAFPMVEIVVLMTFLAWALRSAADFARRRRAGLAAQPVQLSAIDVLVAAYVVLGLAAVTWSPLKGPALTELRTLFLEPAAFYLVARTSVRKQQDLRIVIGAFLLAGIAAAAVGLVQYAFGSAIITAEDGSRRLAGIYGSPNNLALYLGRVIPFLAAAVLLSTTRVGRVIALGVLAVTLIAAFLTQSVGGLFIGIPAGVTIVILTLRGRRALPWLAAAALVALAAFGLLATQSDRFGRALNFAEGTNFYRIRVMQSAINVIADQPVTGLGLDQFLYAFRDRYILPDAWPEPDLSHPHNMLLDFWVRLGIGGAGLALALVVFTLRAAQAAVRRTRNLPHVRWIAVGVLGAFTAVYTHGLVDNSIFVIDLAYVFMLLSFAVQFLGKPEQPSVEPNRQQTAVVH